MIERLTADTAPELTRYGGKACGLVRLINAGLDVPEAWVIPAAVSLDTAQRQACLDHELTAWWADVEAQFPGSRWAVRSSAVAEDLEGASFAGVYETILGVENAEALLQAVKTCWHALEDTRAVSYLATQGMTSEAGIALVLQRMVEADVAGVMLTENPMRPFDDQIVINASWGLGEAVVSGRTDPDTIVLDRGTGEVVSTRIGAKELEIVWDGGIAERAVSVERSKESSLSEQDIANLHALAAQVGEALGQRRDLEWAIEDGRLRVLQDRPITGLPPRDPKEVWTRRFGDEYLADYMSPLGFDLMGPWLIGPNIDEVAVLQRRPEIVEIDKIRRHDGYAYLNGAYVLELVRGLPLDSREGPLAAWFDETFVERIRAVPFERRLLLNALRAPRRDRGRGPVKANILALARHSAAIDASLLPKRKQDYTALSREEWRRQYDEVQAFGEDHFRVIRWGMGHHGPLLQGVLSKLLTRWVGADADQQLQTLISGLPGTMTAAINRDLWDLALLARTESDVLEGLRSDRSYDDVRTRTAGAGFWAAFDAFLVQHGHRSASREVSAHRWHEQPDVVLGLIRAQVRPETPGTSPAEFEERAEARRLETEREVLVAVSKGPLGVVRRKALVHVLGQVQALTVYRENQRYHLDHILNHLHLLLLEQGRRFVERGLLLDQADVFLLTGDTFLAAIEGDVPGLAEDVEQSRQHRAKHEGRLPAAYLFDEVPTEGRVEAPMASADGSLVGFGASSGTVTGTVRSVASLSELSQVEEGDILVASNIDPGWTSVFPLLSGLITETGGILSHGAILAREYGIPTVTSLDGAIGLLPSGTRVTVDGTAGTVLVVE
ncbi:PEP/pyruvate-binding domain-containing protein [Nocardioides sp. WS12]|uniref:PEP/pyruvate-binding domain-containing protein n=1 Tax=Nocardioides sp. WS12 TaxID=2486272 RepID=UPI0015FB3B90|nr:PEP/pyruvate-binding domain-containing protein [Nocardioides sp. WS12]